MINECIFYICGTSSEDTGESTLKKEMEVYIPQIYRRNNYHMKLFTHREISNTPIPKDIAKIFTTYNIFEFKGMKSSITSDFYYKANAHVSFLLAALRKQGQCVRQDVSLSILSHYYPKNLFHHLTEDCELTIEKISPGIFHIHGEMYAIQVLVTHKLPSEEYQYLEWLHRYLNEKPKKHLADDYQKDIRQTVHEHYTEQTANASTDAKEESSTDIKSTMFTESILNICGTSTREIVEKTKAAEAKIYLAQINKLEEEVKQFRDEIAFLESHLALYENN